MPARLEPRTNRQHTSSGAPSMPARNYEVSGHAGRQITSHSHAAATITGGQLPLLLTRLSGIYIFTPPHADRRPSAPHAFPRWRLRRAGPRAWRRCRPRQMPSSPGHRYAGVSPSPRRRQQGKAAHRSVVVDVGRSCARLEQVAGRRAIERFQASLLFTATLPRRCSRRDAISFAPGHCSLAQRQSRIEPRSPFVADDFQRALSSSADARLRAYFFVTNTAVSRVAVNISSHFTYKFASPTGARAGQAEHRQCTAAPGRAEVARRFLPAANASTRRSAYYSIRHFHHDCFHHLGSHMPDFALSSRHHYHHATKEAPHRGGIYFNGTRIRRF